MWNTLALVVGIVIAGFLIGGRYGAVDVYQSGTPGYVVIYDRLSGAAKRCVATVCSPIREDSREAAAE